MKKDMRIADRLRKLRGNRDRRQVAEEMGIAYSALGNYENGIRYPNDRAKQILAIYYGMTVDELFFSNKYHSKRE